MKIIAFAWIPFAVFATCAVASEPVTRQASEQASGHASKQASKQAAKKVSKKVSEQAAERAAKRAAEQASEPSAAMAIAALVARSGSTVSGRLQFSAEGDGVRIIGKIAGVEPDSTHGFHLHETGDCTAEDGSSAGPHFNPKGHAHGHPGEGEHHAGDIPNLVADADGDITVNVLVPGVSLRDGGEGDIHGRAIVLHAKADDYASQPAGNSGARIACGVIE